MTERGSGATSGRTGLLTRVPAPPQGALDAWTSVRRHWRVAVATFAVVVLASILVAVVRDPVYQAQAEVLLRTQDSDQLFPRRTGQAGALARSPVSEAEWVEGDEFQRAAREAAGDDAEVEVRAAPERGSSSLTFVAEAGGADAAAEAASTWASTYVALRQEQDVAETQELRDRLAAERDELAQQRAEVLQPVAALDETIAAQEDPTELSRLLNQRLALQRSLAGELDPVEDDLRRLQDQIAALEVDLAVLEDPEALAAVIDEADPPASPLNGSRGRTVAVGVLAGLVLAAAAVGAVRSRRG